MSGDIQLVSLNDIQYHSEIPETGETIEENATIKARTIFENIKLPCFADDTGLEVDLLNGAPGVHSARYAGESKDAGKNMELLLKNLKGKDNRSAQFKTVISYFDYVGEQHLFTGIIRGTIKKEPTGKEGFGYDPIFVPEGYSITFAQMPLSEKNQISHRAIAFRKLLSFLTTQNES